MFFSDWTTRIRSGRALLDNFSGSRFLHLRARRRWKRRQNESCGTPLSMPVIGSLERVSETLEKLSILLDASCSCSIWRTMMTRVWAAMTRAAMNVWLDRLAALLQLDEVGSYPSSLLSYDERLLSTRNGAKTQTEQNDFVNVVRGRQSLGHFPIATGDASTYLYVTPESSSYVDYLRKRKKVLRRTLVMREVRIPPSSIFVGYGFVQHGESEQCRSDRV